MINEDAHDVKRGWVLCVGESYGGLESPPYLMVNNDIETHFDKLSAIIYDFPTADPKMLYPLPQISKIFTLASPRVINCLLVDGINIQSQYSVVCVAVKHNWPRPDSSCVSTTERELNKIGNFFNSRSLKLNQT